MILLDAYTLVALLADEPAAEDVEVLLREGDAAVTAVNLAEAVDVMQRAHRVPPENVRAALEPLLGKGLALVDHSEDDIWHTAGLRLRHYDRRSCAVSLADCFLLAAASAGDRIATADPAVAAGPQRGDRTG